MSGPKASNDRRLALVLFGDRGPSDALGWAQLDPRTSAVVARGTAGPNEPAPAAAPARTVLVLSGAEAQLRRLALPARTEAQARAGVGYLFEGALVGADDVHFAVGPAQDEDGHRLAAAMSTARLGQWLEACRQRGAAPSAVYLDVSLWPVDPASVAVVAFGDRAMVCGGRHGGYAIEADLAAQLFARWAAQNGARPTRIAVDPALAAGWRALPQLGDAQVQTAPESDAVAVLAAAALDPPNDAPDLLQGAFSARGAAAGPRWQFWSLAAALAVIAVLVQSGVQAVAGWRDAQAASAVSAAAEAEFRAARPQIKRIVNLQAQVRAAANADGQAGAHPVLKATGPLLKAREAHPLVRLDELRHQAPGRAVELRFSAADGAALQALAAWLTAQGLQVQTRDLSPEAGRYGLSVTLEAQP